ncbi:MAG: FAD-binding protein [Actinomycetota bacterium]|nr:FAD-binding protein [Actinomycetota bacterium]
MDLTGPVAQIVGDAHISRDVRIGDTSGLHGIAPVLAQPGSAEEVRELVAWAYAQDVAILPVGGCSGFSGGVVPVFDGPGVAIGLERLDRVRALDPLLWRMEVEAGVRTATVKRLARENGLSFPPDPGAPEQSQIGGNLATNAGGPHAFKYGVTSHWVMGVEAVIAPGELVRFGGPVRKDVAGYDLRGLLIGSEGTLGIITAAWLRLIPAPPEVIPLAAGYDSVEAGVEAIEAALASGVVPAALEYLEGACIALAPPPFMAACPRFMLLAEAESGAERDALLEALGPSAVVCEPLELWRWRSGVSLVVRTARGEKLSEDIVVPLDRLGEAITSTLEIGARHGLETTSWGHAGDGNLHSTFMYDPHDPAQATRVEQAAGDVSDLARRLGGSVSGEHGLGLLKNGQLLGQWAQAAVGAHEQVKRALDPKGLLNPGKKLPRPQR